MLLQTGERLLRRGFGVRIEPAVLRADGERRGDAGAARGVGRELLVIGEDAPQAVLALQADGPSGELLQRGDEIRDVAAILRDGERAREAEDLPCDAARPVAVAVLAGAILACAVEVPAIEKRRLPHAHLHECALHQFFRTARLGDQGQRISDGVGTFARQRAAVLNAAIRQRALPP